MASAIFFLDLKGKVRLADGWVGYQAETDMLADPPRTELPRRHSHVSCREVPHPPQRSRRGILRCPSLLLARRHKRKSHHCLAWVAAPTDLTQYLYIRHNNLYLLALTKRNTNAAEILLFLHKVVEVFTEYFKALEEESIRDNFVIIYELLDEMMDFGYPQTTESKILQEYITQESHKLEVQARPPIAVTNAVSWRSEGIRYRKNEVFLDVVESLNLLVSANGNVLRSEILGAIKMKCYLSGMPELRLGLNDKVMFESTGRTTRGKAIEMEDVKFHQCVRLSRFENDRTISFIPRTASSSSCRTA